MYKYAIVILSVFLLCSCSSTTKNTDNISKIESELSDDTLSVNQTDETNSDEENDIQDNKLTKTEIETKDYSNSAQKNINIKSINENDYVISQRNNSIALDTKYSELEIDLQEIPLEQNSLGEALEDGYRYKFYQYKFDGIDIYTSNLYYNEKERNLNDYYISRITVTSNKFDTLRGVRIGNTYDDIINVYGKNGIEEPGAIIYNYKDKNLKFIFDDMDLLSEISLYVKKESYEEEKGYSIDNDSKKDDEQSKSIIAKNTEQAENDHNIVQQEMESSDENDTVIVAEETNSNTESLKEEIVIYWNGALLGTYNKVNDNWNSIMPIYEDDRGDEITIGDILSCESYAIYENYELIEKVKLVELDYIFKRFGGREGPGMSVDESDLLLEYGSKGITGYEFHLPVRLNENVYNIEVPHESFCMYIRPNGAYHNYKDLLKLSEEATLMPREIIAKGDIPNNTEELINKKFAERKLSQVVPFIKYVYAGDFDNDSKTEYLTIVNNEITKNDYVVVTTKTESEQTAFYNLIIYEDDDASTTIIKEKWDTEITSKVRKKGNDKIYEMVIWEGEDSYSIVRNLLIADLNGDSELEICLGFKENINTVSTEVYSKVDNEYESVLQAVTIY